MNEIEKKQLRLRVGQFEIDDVMMKEFPEAVMATLGRCVITRAEHLAIPGKTFYMGYSPDFDIVDPGAEIPYYVASYNGEQAFFVKQNWGTK